MKVPAETLETPDGRTYIQRSARPGEAGAVYDHAFGIRRSDPDANIEYTDEFTLTSDQMRALLQELEKADNGFFLVAWADSGVVASLVAAGGRHRKTAHVAQLGISVHPEWRRQGVARAVLRAALERARVAPALRRLSRQVFEPNRAAIELYESAGFVVEGRRPGHIHIDGRDAGVLLMGLVL